MGKRSFTKDSKFTMNKRRCRKSREDGVLQVTSCRMEMEVEHLEETTILIAFPGIDNFLTMRETAVHVRTSSRASYDHIDTNSIEYMNPEKDQLHKLDVEVRDEKVFRKETGKNKIETVEEFLARNGKIQYV